MCAGFAAAVGTVAAACLVATCVAQFYSAAPSPSCCCLSCWFACSVYKVSEYVLYFNK
jgi:hypothetical protein